MPRLKTKIDLALAASASRSLRAHEGFTQRQLAAMLECSPGRIGDIERGIIRSQRIAQAILDACAARSLL